MNATIQDQLERVYQLLLYDELFRGLLVAETDERALEEKLLWDDSEACHMVRAQARKMALKELGAFKLAILGELFALFMQQKSSSQRWKTYSARKEEEERKLAAELDLPPLNPDS